MVLRNRTLFVYKNFLCQYLKKKSLFLFLFLPINSIVDLYISSILYVFVVLLLLYRYGGIAVHLFSLWYFIAWIYQNSFIPTFDGYRLFPIFVYYSSSGVYFRHIHILFINFIPMSENAG